MLRCPVCVTRRTTFAAMQRHKAATGHLAPCNCGGYAFPHRPGSGCCELNPYAEFNAARRAGLRGDDLLDAFIDSTMNGRHKPVPPGAPIPF